MNPVLLLKADWSPALERGVRIVGTVVALVVAITWMTGECAYDLGRQLRLAIEARNDQLAAWWIGVLGLQPAAPPAAAPAAAPADSVIVSPVPALIGAAASPAALLPSSRPASQRRKAATAPAMTKPRQAATKPKTRKAAGRRAVAA